MSGQALVVLDYINQFQCIGPTCEDSCCRGWNVTVDRDTYEHYINHPDPAFSTEAKGVLRPPSPGGSGASYSSLKMLPSGECPFLGADFLCSIQTRFGEEMLPPACSGYPREDSMVNGLRERSCSTSCPEVARIVLLRENKLQLSQVEYVPRPGDYLYHRQINTLELEKSDMYKSHFWPLRVASIKALQNRDLSVQDRLMSLGILVDRLERCKASDAEGAIPLLVSEFETQLFNGSLKVELDRLTMSPGHQMEFLSMLADETLMSTVTHQRFRDCFNDFKQGLAACNRATGSDTWMSIAQVYGEEVAPFIRDHAYIFENYLVNQVFKDLFPCGGASPREQFGVLAVHFALIRMFLVGIAARRKVVTVDHCLQLIQSFGRTLERAPAWNKVVGDLFHGKGSSSLALVMVLLKLE